MSGRKGKCGRNFPGDIRSGRQWRRSGSFCGIGSGSRASVQAVGIRGDPSASVPTGSQTVDGRDGIPAFSCQKDVRKREYSARGGSEANAASDRKSLSLRFPKGRVHAGLRSWNTGTSGGPVAAGEPGIPNHCCARSACFPTAPASFWLYPVCTQRRRRLLDQDASPIQLIPLQEMKHCRACRMKRHL